METRKVKLHTGEVVNVDIEELASIGESLLHVPPGSAMTILAANSAYVVIRQSAEDTRDPVSFTKDVLSNGSDRFQSEQEMVGDVVSPDELQKLNGVQ